MLGWSNPELARRARISIPAAYRIEKPEFLINTRMTTLSAVRTTFEASGITFSEEGARFKID